MMMKLGMTLVVVLVLASVAQAGYVFGYSGDAPQLLVLNGGAATLSTATDPISGGGWNQGWWSPSEGNSDDNFNFIAGNYGDGPWNNFFTFSLAGVEGPITSAVLRLEGVYAHSGLPLTYNIFDVSTDPATLNNNSGTSQSIYDDLGSGVFYGSILVTSLNIPTDVALNAAGLAALNAAIEQQSAFFSIGGAISPGEAQIPEPGTAVLLGAALAGLGLLQRRLVR